MFSKIKMQAPQLIPIKVEQPSELVGIDLIGKVCEKLKMIHNGNVLIIFYIFSRAITNNTRWVEIRMHLHRLFHEVCRLLCNQE